MLAFTNTLVSYEQFLADVQRHKALDQYAKGAYWDDEDNKGCAIGCVLHTFMHKPETMDSDSDSAGEDTDDLEYGEHRLFEPMFGIPMQLAQLQDAIFEGLPDTEAMEFPLQFALALKSGTDYGLVWNKFAVWLLTDSEHGVIRFAETDSERQVISNVAALHRRVIAGDTPPQDEWAAARAAARAAAGGAAGAAAGGAAGDAAWAAAWAAAGDAAGAAAWAAAWAAARAAAGAAHYQVMRDKLLSLLAECGEGVAA